VNCDELREQLPDYTLHTLTETEMAAVARHLRGCGGCRADAARLDEGVSLFASAAHAAEPPPDLKPRVMAALADEWTDPAARPEPATSFRQGFVWRRFSVGWLAVAASVVLLAAAVGWGAIGQARAGRYERDAQAYEQFLHALGGRAVRVATVSSSSSIVLDGSAVLYDSDRGQSWALVILRAPGSTGPIGIRITAPGGRAIDMRPIKLDEEGEGSSWLITSTDISAFSRVTLYGPNGSILASAPFTHES
jgi:hypothetical protein